MRLKDILELGTYGFDPSSEVTIFEVENLEAALEENRFLNVYVPAKEDATIAPYGFVIDGDTLVAMTD